ncbi:hypothetical protein HDE_10762 [Halotydeus destructor]|nr:hypothetical protein HDE_10762 [Halotydeus destructor]
MLHKASFASASKNLCEYAKVLLYRLDLYRFGQSWVHHFFGNRIQTRTLCINSAAPNVQSMCVRCDASRFDATSLLCTGQTTVPATTNQTQALCLMTNCLQQIPQQGTSKFGRKKRLADDIDTTNIESDIVLIEQDL